MQGIEEAEKMERGRLRAFYEDHFAIYSALWTFTVIVFSVALSTTAGLIFNRPQPTEPPNWNITIPKDAIKIEWPAAPVKKE